MINLSSFPKISQDLISSAINVDYLLHIKIPNNDVYIATRGQTFDVGNTSVYWEDKDLNISAINEKININSKKIYISNTSITLNNYEVFGSRISDLIGDGFGTMMDLYIKTPSCQSINDCMKMANLKIIRLDHDDKKVKISAEDAAQQGFYIDLPRIDNILNEDETFEFYVDKPVPILYGHLESAPAVVYVDGYIDNVNIYENNSITLLPDNSYLEEGIEILGIKDFGASNLYDGMSSPGFIDSTLLELVNNNIVQISIGGVACSVNCYPYWNTAHDVMKKFKGNTYNGYYPQYEPNKDHIRLMSKYEGEDTLLKNQALWTHTTSKFISKKGIVLGCYSSMPESSSTPAYYFYNEAHEQYYNDNLFFGGSIMGQSQGTLYTRKLIQEDDATGYLPLDFEWWEHKVGVETLSFEPLSGANPYEVIKSDGTTKSYPTDIHFTGRFYLKVFSYSFNIQYHENKARFWMIGYPSGITSNDAFLAEPGASAENIENLASSSDIGFPTEVSGDFKHNYFPNDHNEHFDVNMFKNMTLIHTAVDDDDEYISEGGDNHIFRNMYRLSSASSGDVDTKTYSSYLNPLNSIDSGSWAEGLPDSPFINFVHEKPKESTGLNFNFLNSNEITFYYMWDPYLGLENNTASSSPSAEYRIETNYNNPYLRRTWAESDVFSKDFFLDAKGRVGSDVQDSNYSFVNGVMEVKYEGISPSPTASVEQEGNDHLENLYYLITNKESQRKRVGRESYDLMIMTSHNGELSFLYDIAILDIKQTEDLVLSNELSQTNRISGDDETFDISHSVGWNVNFSANTLGNFYNRLINGVNYNILKGVRLVYGKKNYSYSGSQLIVTSVDILDEPGDEIDNFNLSNGCTEDELYSGDYVGYTTIYFNENNKNNNGYLLEKPAEVLRNLIETELSPSSEPFDTFKFSQALINDKYINFALSVNEVESSRDVIEKMCYQSRMMFRYRARDNKPIIETLKNRYTSSDVVKTIDPENMISFSYSKTKFEDVCIGGCIVRYGKNYTNNSLSKETLKKEFDEQTLSAYKEYYSISDERNHILEVEAPYIQDQPSAIELRDYLFELNKNQHLICKFKLSIRDGLELEPGDVIDFSKDPIKVKPYGTSITSFSAKVDQIIYPYFLITSVSKKATEVSIEAYQLHELDESIAETTLLGDVNLDGQVNYHDRNLLLSYVLGNVALSEQQIANADINGDSNIDIYDVEAIENLDYYDQAPEEEHIDDVFEQLRSRLNPVLETINLDLDQIDIFQNTFYYNLQSDSPFSFTHNSYVDEEPFPEISLNITKVRYIVKRDSTGETVEEFETDAYANGSPTLFDWDISNLINGEQYSVRMKVIAEAVEYGYNGEQRNLESDLSSSFIFIVTDESQSLLIPVLSINGENSLLYVEPNQWLSLSAEDSFFQFSDGSIDTSGGEITNYQFYCVYLYDNTGEGFLTPGNIVFSQNQDSPSMTSMLQSPGRYRCYLWAQSPSGVQYDPLGTTNPRNTVDIQITP